MKTLHLNRAGAIGDIIMTLIAIDKYKKLNPNDKIVYYCDPSWKDLPLICPAVDEVRSSADFDLKTPGAQNLYGYGAIPLIKHLTWYFGKELGLDDTFYNYGFKPVFKPSNSGELNSLLLENRKIITLHTNAGWSIYKNWNKWEGVIEKFYRAGLDKEYTIVQIGKEDVTLNGVIDMRNKLTVTECIQLIKKATLHLGVDSFSNHATALLPYTPSVILWGSTHPGIFGYGHNTNIWKPLQCSPCNKLLNDKCPLEPNQCINNITVDEVFNAILKKLEMA